MVDGASVTEFYYFAFIFLQKLLMGKIFTVLSTIFSILSFTGQPLHSADIQSIGVPFVQTYTKSLYQAGNQNWSISKGAGGKMYFGNSEGLLSFDGKYWQLYRLPNRQIVRAIAADSSGKVFVGGFGEFGYFSYQPSGLFKYTSLVGQLRKAEQPKEEIWKIYIIGKKVIFQSFASIYIFENGKLITRLREQDPFLFMFKAGNRLFVEVLSKGLYEVRNNKLHLLFENQSFGGRILSILPFNKNTFVAGTAKNGLFLFDEKGIRPWNTDGDAFLRKNQLNNGALINDKYLAFGTILNGIVIIDKTGRIVQRIDKASGLHNNTVLSLFTDENQNLWAGLNSGIDRVDISSPLYFYFDKTGKVGTVFSSIIHQNKIYLGTNQGLFYSEWSSGNSKLFQSFDFKLIEGSQGQVWDLSLIDNELLCGHNEGTYKVTGSSIHKISDVKGGWTIKKLKDRPDILIQGTYTGLALYQKNGHGHWQFLHQITGFREPSKYLEQDAKGNIWVSHAYHGIYKLVLSENLKKVIHLKSYDQKHGLPGIYRIGVLNLEGEIVFSTDSGFYTFDDISDRFQYYKGLNDGLGSFATAKKIIHAKGRQYWLINDGKVVLADFAEPGKIAIDSSTFNVLKGRMVPHYEDIRLIGNALYLFSIDDGFGIFNAASYSKTLSVLPRVLMHKIENTTDKIVVLAEKGRNITVSHDANSVRISFSLPIYNQTTTKYQFYLEGYSKEWSEWSVQSQKEFSNLPPGQYIFNVRALVDDELISSVSSLSIRVLAPWYQTWWAYLAYVLFFITVLHFGRKHYRLKLQKHKNLLQSKLEREQEEHLQKESVINEQRIVKLKNAQLEADLENKNRELAHTAMNIVSKNELLQRLRNEICSEKDQQGEKISDVRLKRMEKVINDGMNDESDWNLFENSFNQAHGYFFKRLKSNHPDLVPNDFKLCAYLRMNMSSKEIASLLTITLRGVEIRRYRLRKKLNLSQDKNLVEFLMEL